MDKYLVSYEYGSGTIWGYVKAAGPHEVLAFLPEVDIWENPPGWLSARELAELAAQPAIEVDDIHVIDALFAGFQGMNAALAS